MPKCPREETLFDDTKSSFIKRNHIAIAVAHETGHVINQHTMRAVAQSMVIAIAVGLVFGIDDSFIEEITTLSTSLILSNQSRKFETEADQVSLEILQKLGRDPESMVKFFGKVAAECGEGCNNPNFFDSHPRLDHRRALFE